MLVDTSRCLHFGARSHGKDRLVLLLQYVEIDKYFPFHLELGDVSPVRMSDRFAERALRRRLHRRPAAASAS